MGTTNAVKTVTFKIDELSTERGNDSMAGGTNNSKRRPIAIDLFCGAGGMAVGFEQAGFDILLGVDVDGHHAATHARNFPYGTTLCKSVAELTGNDVRGVIGSASDVDLIFGGPPCQGFSHMGLRDTQDPRNTLVDQFVRLVSEVKPRAFVMENVPGMLAGDTRRVLDRAISDFEKAGFRIVKPIRVLDASEFGVPQKRKRLFVIGIRSDIEREMNYPEGPCPGQAARPTVWTAISDLPDVERYESLLDEDEIAYDKLADSAYAKVARGVDIDPSDFSHPRDWPSDICSGSLRINHSPKSVELYSVTPQGQMVPGHKLPKLSVDGICTTLRAGSDSTHGSHTAPRPVHPLLPRCITAREAARLHGFPDWFWFYPSKWHAYRQIGNAVCPPVARAVGSQVLLTLGEMPRKPVRSIKLDRNFELCDARPRSLRRIPHMTHYPPVIAHLFERAFDESTGRLWRSRFTFDDVREAINTTKANLPWTRADNFISDIARSRNVQKLLSVCLARGFSLRSVADGDFIGEFAPVGTPGTIGSTESLVIRSGDMESAVAIRLHSFVGTEDFGSIAKLVTSSEVIEALWPDRKLRVDVHRMASSRAVYSLINGRGIAGTGSLTLASMGNPPAYASLIKSARRDGVKEVVVAVPVTSKHLLLARFDTVGDTPVEVTRMTCEVESIIAVKGRRVEKVGKK